jgi:hypothetical protein
MMTEDAEFALRFRAGDRGWLGLTFPPLTRYRIEELFVNSYRGIPMRKIVVLALSVLGVLALAGPAQAGPQYASPHGHSCSPHSVGYNAWGTLVSSSLTVDADGRYSGTIEVDVKRANHGGATGVQTYTLTAARVKFHNGVDPNAPAPGSRVRVHGKVTKLNKHCSTEGFTPTITVRRVDIHVPKQP